MTNFFIFFIFRYWKLYLRGRGRGREGGQGRREEEEEKEEEKDYYAINGFNDICR